MYIWGIAGLFLLSDILHTSFISELSVLNYRAYFIAGKALSVDVYLPNGILHSCLYYNSGKGKDIPVTGH
jgi:hypothetical protein